MSEVNRERVALGVAALRSGEYEQCRKVLIERRWGTPNWPETKSYCCLGVLTEVAIANGLEGLKEAENGWGWRDEHGQRSTNAELPEPVREWYGFEHTNPSITNDHVAAAEANDDLKWNFLQIADAFEGLYLSEPPEEVSGEA